MIEEAGWTRLSLGADVVQMLLPHRRPFLLVDAVDAIALGDKPMLRARKLVSANEPVFDGHFPGLSLWPGVYTIEGLGQTSNILDVMLGVLEGARAENISPEAVLEGLRALEKRSRPGVVASASAEQERLLRALGTTRARIGLAGAIDVKLIEPVLAGTTLEYRVTRTHVVANARRYEVEARVADRPVARGTLSSAVS